MDSKSFITDLTIDLLCEKDATGQTRVMALYIDCSS